MTNRPQTYQLHPIGRVRASDADGRYHLEIDRPYRPALKQMDQFSHILILWWADRINTPYNYLVRRRLSQAALEMLDRDCTILELALAYQFNHPETFSRAFKRMFEMAPSQ